jgi:hypothetical protein
MSFKIFENYIYFQIFYINFDIIIFFKKLKNEEKFEDLKIYILKIFTQKQSFK